MKQEQTVYNLEELRLNTAQCKLVWKDLYFSISKGNFIKNKLGLCFPSLKPSCKTILHGVSGYAEPGTFLAIIGPSGAGKTTLLNYLCCRTRIGSMKGDFTYNGTPIKSRNEKNKYRKIIGYVMQHDALLPFLTVQETLLYSGMLTLPRELSTSTKLDRIKEVMKELGLSKIAHQYVGSELVRGISGGEKKRLSIAIELLRNPSVLFLDEPTSGLDAKNALRLCEKLARLAHKYNYTIITTIHQPRSQIFEQFDNLLILAAGGKQVYFGPAKDTLDYFASEGFNCPVHENPADYFIDCVTEDFKDIEMEEIASSNIKQLENAWEKKGLLNDLDPYNLDNSNNNYDLSTQQRKQSATIFAQIFWILYQGILNEIRNKPFLFARLAQNVFLAVVLGVLYFQIDNDQSTIADRNGISFFVIINSCFNELMPAVAIFATQREVFFRERDSKTYSILAFWIGKQLSMAFFHLAYPAVFIFIVYWLIGFQTEWYKFFIFFATLELVSLICGTVGLTLGASLPPSSAAAIAPIFAIVNMVFSGFLVNLDNIPVFLRWIQYISFGKYAFDNLIQNEYTGLTLTCDSDQLVGMPPQCPFTSGEQIIENLNLTELPYYVNLLILFGMLVFYRCILYLAFKKGRPTGM